MSVSKRPWSLRDHPGEYVMVCDGEGYSVLYDEGVPNEETAAHIVAAVNALHAAGITPEALAADSECVKKLVAAAVRFAPGDVIQKERREIAMEDALTACGIEVKP